MPQGFLGLTHEIVAKTEKDNDGLVSVTSATMERAGWQTLEPWSANHYRLVNWGENIAPTPLELIDNSIVQKYLGLAGRLKTLDQ